MRWKYFLPTVIILAVVTVFYIFFFDALLKRGLVAAGELAFGAKVEVASLRTQISKLSIDIQGIQVANRQSPMQNLVETDKVAFALEPVPLLSKKFVIDEMLVEGVRWGTARKTSGALPPKKQSQADKLRSQDSFLGKLAAKLEAKGKAELAALPAFDSIKSAQEQFKNLSVDKLVNVNDLQVVKEYDALRTGYQQKAAAYEAQIKNLDVAGKLNSLQPALNEVAAIKIQNAQDVLAAKDKIERLRQQLGTVQALAGTVKNLQTQIEADFGQQKNLLDRLNDLKNRDLQGIAGKLNLPSFAAGDLARALVGPMWLNRIQQMLNLAQTARRYLPPPKPKEKKVVRQRLKGIDVSFPLKNVPPDFLIKLIRLSGSTGGPGKEGAPIDFHGTVTDITSDPGLLGRPLQAELSGIQGRKIIALSATLDHTKETPIDTVMLNVKGWEVAEFKLPSSDYLPAFDRGTASLESKFVLAGDQFDSTLAIQASGLATPKSVQASEIKDARDVARFLWQGIDQVLIGVKVSGKQDDLQMSVSSNLDKLLGDRMQKLLGQKLAEVQARLKQEVDRLTAAKQAELLKQFDASKGQALGQSSSQLKDIQAKLDQGQGLVKQKQDAVQGAADEQKRKAEEELKNKAQDQLKNFNPFKR